jgi:hypothetical protein
LTPLAAFGYVAQVCPENPGIPDPFKEKQMKFGRPCWAGTALILAVVAVLPACRRRKAEVNDIVPSISFNRTSVPLGSPLEITYTWTVEPTAKKLTQDYRAFVHFLDSHKINLFGDDHAPVPPTTQWEPGKTYSYTRTMFIPIYPYVGDLEVRIGMDPAGARGERLTLKAEDAGMGEFRIGKLELLPQTENIFLVYKEGWHNPETSPQNPSLERMWTKRNAMVSFKNPKKDLIVYLEADTNAKAFDAPPVLTVSAGKTGLVIPIENSEVFLKKIRVKGADLGTQDWVDLRLDMNQSFVPKLKGVNTNDDRELGLLVYHLYVGEADKMGQVPGVVEATPVTVPSPAPAASAKPAAVTSAKPVGSTKAPAAATATPAARPASPGARPSPGTRP